MADFKFWTIEDFRKVASEVNLAMTMANEEVLKDRESKWTCPEYKKKGE